MVIWHHSMTFTSLPCKLYYILPSYSFEYICCSQYQNNVVSLKPPQIFQYKSNNNFTVNHVNNHFMKHLHNVTSSCALTNCPSLNVVDIGNTNIELVYQSNIWNRLTISVGICYAIKCGTFLGCSVMPLKWQIEG